MSSPLLPITMGEQIALIEGCEFVGVSDTGEVFVSWHDIDPASKEGAIKLISDWPEVTAVTEVHSVSRKEVQALVEGLNKLMEETEEHPNVNCLPGGDTAAGGGAGEAVREFLESYGIDSADSGSCSGGGCGGKCGGGEEQPEESHVREKGCGKSPSGDGCGGCRH